MRALLDARFAKPVMYAGLFTFTMFWTMHLLIAGGRYKPGDDAFMPVVDFVRLKKDTDIQERDRRKPEKPPPPKTPPPPKMQVEQPPPDTPPTPFQMPKLDLPTRVTGGPFMGNYGGGEASGDLTPKVRIAPQYPRQAARDGVEGYVMFELVVNPDGTVRSARVLKAEPRGYFERDATNAVYKWRFAPKMVDGKAVESKGTVRVEFTLEDEEAG